MKNQEEVWLPVKGYEGFYEVSNFGNVKSLNRKKWNNWTWQKIPEKILSSGKNKNGYLYVGLCKNGLQKSFAIHQLVMMTFKMHIPNGFNGLVIDHINAIKTDNRLENLQLVTNKENNLKKFRDKEAFKKADEIVNKQLNKHESN